MEYMRMTYILLACFAMTGSLFADCTVTASFVSTLPIAVAVSYVSYQNATNITGIGAAFDYSAGVFNSAIGSPDAFGLMLLSTIFIGFYLIGSRYTQERALVFSVFMVTIAAFLLVSGNFLSPNWLILCIIALLAALYFSSRIG